MKIAFILISIWCNSDGSSCYTGQTHKFDSVYDCYQAALALNKADKEEKIPTYYRCVDVP